MMSFVLKMTAVHLTFAWVNIVRPDHCEAGGIKTEPHQADPGKELRRKETFRREVRGEL
jgi:hypothetical protein